MSRFYRAALDEQETLPRSPPNKLRKHREATQPSPAVQTRDRYVDLLGRRNESSPAHLGFHLLACGGGHGHPRYEIRQACVADHLQFVAPSHHFDGDYRVLESFRSPFGDVEEQLARRLRSHLELAGTVLEASDAAVDPPRIDAKGPNSVDLVWAHDGRRLVMTFQSAGTIVFRASDALTGEAGGIHDVVDMVKQVFWLATGQRVAQATRREQQTAQAPDLAALLEQLCTRSEEDEAMGKLLDVLEADLKAEKFTEVDALLECLNPQRLAVGVTLVALSITWHARDHLKQRTDFFDRAAQALQASLGAERADALLASRR